MLDLIARSNEQYISFATSYDESNPPENVLISHDDSFWMTTGIFPQMIVISLMEHSKISRIKIISGNIKDLWVETSSQIEPDNFELKSELTLSPSDDHQQVTEVPINDLYVRHVRLNIRSGYDHFIAIYQVTLERKTSSA